MFDFYSSLNYRFQKWSLSSYLRELIEEDFKAIQLCVDEMVALSRIEQLETSRV